MKIMYADFDLSPEYDVVLRRKHATTTCAIYEGVPSQKMEHVLEVTKGKENLDAGCTIKKKRERQYHAYKNHGHLCYVDFKVLGVEIDSIKSGELIVRKVQPGPNSYKSVLQDQCLKKRLQRVKLSVNMNQTFVFTTSKRLRVVHVLFKERYEDGIQEWSINGRVPLFSTSTHDNVKTIHPARNLDRNSKMINGDQFAIAKAAGMKFSESNHMYPSYKIRMSGGHHLTNKLTIKAIGSHRLSTFTKRVMNVKEMASMEVLCSYKTLI